MVKSESFSGHPTPCSGDIVPETSTFFINHAGRYMEQSLHEPFAPMDILKEWKEKVVKKKPTSILVVSPHWDTLYPTVNVISGVNPTLHDAEEMHESFYTHTISELQFKYPAPGASELAKRVKELLIASGFDRVDEDTTRGLDHGIWVPLLLMYPEADIPVCQLSIQSHKDPTHHYNLEKSLAPLKEELGVMIIGAGSATNNVEVQGKAQHDDVVIPWAMEYDTWLMDALLQGRYDDVLEYAEKAPHARLAHPEPSHTYPLHVAIGAAGDDAEAHLINQGWDNAALSFASYIFTSKSPSVTTN